LPICLLQAIAICLLKSKGGGLDRRSLPMNIHEYQAKELLQKFDVATTRGRVASTLDQAEQIARELGDVEIVVKAQIHAGGRGKGTFTN